MSAYERNDKDNEGEKELEIVVKRFSRVKRCLTPHF